MKIRYTVILVVFLITAFGEDMHAQCPSVQAIYEKLEKGNSELDDRKLLALSLELRNRFALCKYQNDSVSAKILHVVGRSYWQLNDLAPGKKFTEASIRLNSSGSPTARRENCANSYLNLGRIERKLNHVQSSLAAFQNGISLCEKYPSKAYLLTLFYPMLANLFYDSGDYQKCIAYAETGEKVSARQGSFTAQMNCRFEKIQALIALGSVKEAYYLLQNTENAVSKIGDHSSKGFIMTQIANVYGAQAEHVKAIEAYKKSLQEFALQLKMISTDNEALFNCAVASNNIGNIYLEDLKDYPNALLYFKQSLSYVNEDMARARVLGNIADTYSKMLNFRLALDKYNEALVKVGSRNPAVRNDQNPSAETIRGTSGKLYLLTVIQDKANTWLNYAKHTRNDRFKLQNALKTYMLADTMIDYMRWEHSGAVIKLFWRDKTRSMYEKAIETCYLLNDPEKAFYFFEKSRAVMLNDALNELGANQLLNAKDRQKEGLLRQKVTALQNKISEHEGNEKESTALRSQLFTAQGEQENFIRDLERFSPQYYAYKYDNHIPAIQEIRQKILPDNQIFVSYFVGDSAIYGLSISTKNIALKKINLPGYQRNNAIFQRLIGNREAQNREFNTYLSASCGLYYLLLKPFQIAAGSRIIISPDGSFLPFEALSASGSTPDYLVKKYAFSYTYSAGFLAKSFRSPKSAFSTKTFLGFAPVHFIRATEQASLPGSDDALETIDKHFLCSKSLTGAKALRIAFVKESPDYRIVQLLTHATADSTGIVPTLYFADSTLKLNELSSTKKSSTQLLVLSACRTGVGKNQRGEGVFSLARGFAAMGIPSVLTTLWSVENESVYRLTNLFYEELEKDLPLDLALQRAQNNLLKNASRSEQLPYAWAGVVLIGNTEPVGSDMPRYMACIFLAGAILVSTGLFLFLLRSSGRR